MDWDDFQAKARRAIPQQELKPKRCWIGVLSHEKAPQDQLEETDFVWMIGHPKIPISKIHETYQKRHEDVDFQLKFRDIIAEKRHTVKSFLAPNSDLVLFVSCLSDQSQQLTAHRFAKETESDIRTSTVPNPLLAKHVKNEPQDDLGLPAARDMSMNQIPSMQHVPCAADIHTRNVVEANNEPDEAPTAHPDSIPAKNEVIPEPIFHHMQQETHLPFDPEKFFNREPSSEPTSQEQNRPTDRAIRDLISQRDPQLLEAGVAQSMRILQSLKSCFSKHTSQDADAWTEAIDKLIPQAERKRTIVGVVGNTGAGKSSVINAMLDEERLVPTNCMRACTAVVTEMSWNASTNPAEKYRAEIEFVSRNEWGKELTTLMKEFLTDNGGISKEVGDETSDAGIAWAKFHGVYPKRTRDSLSDCTVEDLMAERSVLAVLGTTKRIDTQYPNSFYKQLQRYVDSKEKVTKKGKDNDPKKTFDMEYWPLIKVVRLYVKAPALSTGAVIVDLPGVHDSNAARAAVAQGYMKQCTGLWIVAPSMFFLLYYIAYLSIELRAYANFIPLRLVNRAVDDKAAKNLLGESFKRQLKYDGGFSSVTFICSKTDDISITEAVDTLELNEEVEGLFNQQQYLEQEMDAVQEKIDELKETQDIYRIAQADAAKDIETWEELQERLDDGKPAYAPTMRNKRKKIQQKNARKRRQRDLDDSDDDFIASDEGSAEDDSVSGDDDIQPPQRPLTEDDIKIKLKDLRKAKKDARRQGQALTEQIKELRLQIRDSRSKIAAIKAEISHICIAGRNDYSKCAIQQDFAAGLRELDQENAAEENEDNFNPDEDIRDYEEVARSLPVFCVSSRAYQQMSGRLQKDDAVPGFKVPEETEMPQLQAHCKKLTEAGRIQTARTFLLSLCQQLTTFALWASDDGTGLKMTDDDKRQQIKYLDKRLNELEKGLEESVRACLNAMKTDMNDQIFDKYPDLINEAINAAPDTAQKWGAHRTDGGLLWATYKAVVRRDGHYHSSTAGHRDFNADLVNPIVKKLATGWERAFQNKLPKAFETFVKDSGRLLHSFHQAVEDRARSNGVGLASLAALKTQIHTYEQLFADLNQVLITRMTELQREANRDFTPTIANIMHTVYDVCANEHGMGSFKRMKEHMTNHVDQYRQHMFHDATLTVKHHLDSLCKALEQVMEEKADEIFVKMQLDYKRVLGGGQVQVDQEALLPKAERALRSEVMKILRSVDAQFEPIARGELESDAEADVLDVSAEPHVAVDDEESAFESAYESPSRGANDDIMFTEPTVSKHYADDVDMNDKENRSLPTPSEEGVTEEEL